MVGTIAENVSSPRAIESPSVISRSLARTKTGGRTPESTAKTNARGTRNGFVDDKMVKRSL